MARRSIHDSAAAATDRERAREFVVSGRNCVRGRAGGGRARRVVRGARVLGTGNRRRLYILHEYAARMAGAARLSAEMVSGVVVSSGDYVGISRRGLHHRAESGGGAVWRGGV